MDAAAARRVWNRSGRILEEARRFQNFEGKSDGYAAKVEPAVFGRRHPGLGLEGAVERPQRLEAGIQRDGGDRHFGLRRIGQRRLCLFNPVIVQEDVEVAVAELLVDQPADPVFRNAEPGGERPDGDALMAVDAFIRHQPVERIGELRVGRRRRIDLWWGGLPERRGAHEDVVAGGPHHRPGNRGGDAGQNHGVDHAEELRWRIAAGDELQEGIDPAIDRGGGHDEHPQPTAGLHQVDGP